ncbi:hypothetical protein PQO74_000023 [Campylobacter lari]|uniref:hypothetical protein n=1 Tax=Campylobacter lari TaxID=201 RepID=UPI001276DE76|nr:hypothetical protein [Campylobacter lari]EAI4828422.1 hypothetical protein [Campylobacter lari]EAK0794068.1 hypothetical protein [Campylobacter lari]EAK0800258.1 hypothetical protein [Campylobacter lari]EAL0061443.1 hypothetical protein [Campylobacter lari]EIV5072246.1 hypothetical protein [Campylobacter lari]
MKNKIIASLLCFGFLNYSYAVEKEDYELLQTAIIKLLKENEQIKQRLAKLEEGKIPTQNINDKSKNNSESDLFLDQVKLDFLDGKKIIRARTIKNAKIKNKPYENSKTIQSIQANNKIYIKGLVQTADGKNWYKIEDGMFIDSSFVGYFK